MGKRIRISLGMTALMLFTALGGYKFIDVRIFLPWLLAVVLHELGHLAMAVCLDVRVSSVRLGIFGARISLEGRVISYGKEALIAMAGPAVNLICGTMLLRIYPSFSEFSFLLGVLNLLPIVSFDGYRLIYCLASKLSDERRAETILKATSAAFVFLIWLFSVYLLIRYNASFSLFVFACALIFRCAT